MIRQGIICGLIIISNSILLSATILTPLKVDPTTLHLYKAGLRNELDYILKRSSAFRNVEESPDSKERRSQMGSSFIRFGRAHFDNNNNNNENAEFLPINFNQVDTGASRIPRGRSDVIIRFGRSGLRRKLDSLGYREQMLKIFPIDLEQLAYVCPGVLAASDTDGFTELTRLCTSLTLGTNETDNKNKE